MNGETDGTTHQPPAIPSGNELSSVIRIFTETNEHLTRSYEKLRWLGFLAVCGVMLVVATFVIAVLPGFSLPVSSQFLFASIGFAILLLSGAVLAMQNVHAYHLESRNRDFAFRALELKHQQTAEIVKQPVDRPSNDSYKPPTG
jgi:hypothetical protein